MTILEILLIAVIWIYIGTWINRKREYYTEMPHFIENEHDRHIAMFLNVFLSPLVMLWIILKSVYRYVVVEDWK